MNKKKAVILSVSVTVMLSIFFFLNKGTLIDKNNLNVFLDYDIELNTLHIDGEVKEGYIKSVTTKADIVNTGDIEVIVKVSKLPLKTTKKFNLEVPLSNPDSTVYFVLSNGSIPFMSGEGIHSSLTELHNTEVIKEERTIIDPNIITQIISLSETIDALPTDIELNDVSYELILGVTRVEIYNFNPIDTSSSVDTSNIKFVQPVSKNEVYVLWGDNTYKLDTKSFNTIINLFGG